MKTLKTKTEKRKARDAFKRFIRIRDCLKATGTIIGGECYTCSRRLPFEKLEAGHFIQGSHDSVYFDERNCHTQCKKCNRFMHANLLPYTLRMIQDYGKKAIEELRQKDRELSDMKAFDFHVIYEKYKAKLERYETQ
jgi:hypothetical protein